MKKRKIIKRLLAQWKLFINALTKSRKAWYVLIITKKRCTRTPGRKLLL